MMLTFAARPSGADELDRFSLAAQPYRCRKKGCCETQADPHARTGQKLDGVQLREADRGNPSGHVEVAVRLDDKRGNSKCGCVSAHQTMRNQSSEIVGAERNFLDQADRERRKQSP